MPKENKKELRDEKSPSSVPALVNALRIIRYLNVARTSAGVNHIASELDISSGTCFRLLKTLVAEELLSFDEQDKTYQPATGLISLARGAFRHGEHPKLRHIIEQLAEKYESTAMLMMPIGTTKAVITDVVEFDSPLRLRIDVGEEFHFLDGAFGRCFASLTNLNKSELKDLFGSVRWDNPIPFETYFKQVQSAKEDRYAIDIADHMEGVAKISSAMRASKHMPKLAISVLTFANKFSKDEYKVIGEELRDIIDSLETDMYYRTQ